MNNYIKPKRAEERFRKISEGFSHLGSNPIENINHLTALCGELLGGDCALYNRLDQGMLCSWGMWKTPPGYNPKDKPKGHLCYDVIKKAKDNLMIIRNLPKTRFAKSDPNVLPYSLQTYIGKAVKLGEESLGSLCVVYQKDFVPDTEDQRVMEIIASAIAVEEKRHRAEEKQREINHTLQEFIEASPLAIAVIDLEGKVQKWNPTAERMFGWKEKEVIGKFNPLVTENRKNEFRTILSTARQNKQMPQSEVRVKRKDGTEIDIEIYRTILHDLDGKVRGIMARHTDITKYKETDKALQESAEQFKGLAEQSPNMIFINQKGKVVYANKKCEEIMGYSKEELLSSSFDFRSLIAPQSQKLIQDAFTRHSQGKEVSPYEYSLISRDGSKIEAIITSKLINYLGDSAILGIITDITARKQAEETLHKSFQQQTLVLKSVPMVFYTAKASTDMATIWISEQVEQITGFAPKKFLEDAMFWASRLHPDDREQALKEYYAVLDKGSISIEYRWQCADNSYHWFSDQIVLTRDGKGKPREAIGIWLDITERKQAMGSIVKFKKAIEASGEVIFMTDREGTITFINPEFTRLYGYEPGDVVGKVTPRILKSGTLKAENYKVFWDTLLNKQIVRGELINRTKDGRLITIVSSANPILDELGNITGFLAIQQDITERKHAEVALQESEEKYRQVLENVDEIIYRIRITDDNLLGGKVDFVSRQSKKIIGYSAEEFVNDPALWFKAIHPDDIESVRKQTKEVLTTHQGVTREYRLRHKDTGEYRWLEDRILPQFDSSAKIISLFGMARDITERKLTAKEREQNISLLRATLESTTDGILVVDRSGRISDYNDRFTQMWRIPETILTSHDDNQAIQFVLDQLKDPDDFLSKVKELYSNLEADSYDLLEFKDGRYFERYSHPQKIEGKPVGRVWSFRDITERKHTHELFVASEQSYRGLFNSVGDAIYVHDSEGKFLDVNNEAVKMYGYPREYFIGKTPEFLSAPGKNDMVATVKAIQNAFAGVPQHFEWWGMRKNGEIFPKDIRLTKGSYFGKDVIIAIARDITERKRVEEALRESEGRYRSLFDKMMDGVYRSTHEGRFIDVNDAMVKMFGFSSKEEMLQVDIKKELYFAPSDRDSLFLDTGQEKVEVFRMRKKDGTEIWVEDHGHYVHDEHGKVIFHEGILRNVTERLRTEVLQSAIYQIAQGANQASTLDDLFKSLHAIIGTVMPAKNFYISLYDETKNLISFPYFVDEVDVAGPPIQPGKGLTAYVLRTGKPLLCDEATDMKLRQQGEVELVGAPSAIWLGVPLIVSHKTIGVMVVQHYSDPKAYGQSDLQMLEFVSSQIAKAIEQKRSEEALKRSEAKYRIVADNTYDWEFWRNPQGEYLYISPYCKRITGRDANDFINDPKLFDKIIHPDDQERMKHHRSEPPSEMKFEELEYRIIHIDGSVRWINHVCMPLFDSSGVFIGIRGSNSDITERKLAEEKLRHSEEQFRLISENVADLIAVVDLNGKRLYNSPSYKNILGDPSSLIGTDSFQEIHPEDRERIKLIFQETVKSGVGQRAEYRFLLRDGSIRHIESQGSVIKNKDGKISRILIVSRDVTEKKKLEEQFLRSQRMESIGTLAGGIAHDLNNVLAPIMMAIEILRMKNPGKDSQRILETVESSARRGADIVKQVLAFARGMEGDRVIIQPKHVINEIVKIIRETFPRSIDIRTEIPKDTWTIVADPTQLHQVLLNVCVNARDAMPDGGKLTISVENLRIDDNYSKMHTEAKIGPYVVISISDTGAGIPAKILPKIFEPFFTTKEVGEGTGLGLSTVHAIVKSHGGFINVYSEIGKETTFKIHFPSQLKDQISPTEIIPSEPPQGHDEYILVVDDEATIREITKETLETNGYNVFTANDGTEAIALYAQHIDKIKVVITDIMMPVMDGEKTIRALRKLNPSVKIIAASGLTSHGNIKTMDPSVHMFLSKPYTGEKLLIAVRDVLAKED